MKNFIGFVFLCLLIINSVFANELRITGKGKTFDEAKQNAFRTAVEFKVGSVVTGERESYNSRLVRDEIIVYSAGYVERYKLIDQFMSGNEVIVIMDILVSDSKIAQRLLGQGSTNNQFDGSNFDAQVKSLLDEKNKGTKLLKNVLNDYPKHAFVVTQGKHYIQLTNYNVPVLHIPYEFKFNDNYLYALRETLEKLSDIDPRFLDRKPSVVTINSRMPNGIIGKRSTHWFRDFTKVEMVSNHLFYNEPRILIKLKSGNNSTNFCYNLKFTHGEGSFYSNGEKYNVHIYGHIVEKGVITIEVNNNLLNQLSVIQEIELLIVHQSVCR